MAFADEKIQFVIWFIETQLVTRVRRNHKLGYHKSPPSTDTIQRWHKVFLEEGSVRDWRRSGRPKKDDATLDRVQEMFHSDPSTSVRSAARFYRLLEQLFHRILKSILSFRPYKNQMLHKFEENDEPGRNFFAVSLLPRRDNDQKFLEKKCFCNEATFHVSWKLNRKKWGFVAQKLLLKPEN